MKKNGFTLIELSAVVAILAILSLIIIPKAKNIIDSNKNKTCDSIRLSALDAAKSYSYIHMTAVDSAITSTGYFDVTILTLQQEGLLKTDIENPKTGQLIPTSNVVRITKINDNYSYDYRGADC